MVVVEGEALSLLTSKTGTWRSVRPVLVEGLAPCMNSCPAGTRIQEYLNLLQEGQVKEAWALLQQDNPLASITGRVCPCFCEPDCNREKFDEPVAIKALERILGDYGLRQGFSLPDITSKEERVAIIGSGPAGLSAAYHLARYGYRVTVFEERPKAGGMLVWGIPEHRLPREIVEKVIESIRGSGVEIKTGVAIGREVSFNDLFDEGYGAILIATGAWKDLKLNLPGEDAESVFPGVGLLNRVSSGDPVKIGEKVCVIGGGNTAIDSARVAARLGTGNVDVLYRRSREEMPALPEEVKAALEEGIVIQFLVTPVEIVIEDGKVSGLRCIRMKLGEPDDTGRRKPLPIPGSEFDVEADMVIVAVGQRPDLSFLDGLGIEISKEGFISFDPGNCATNFPKVFVAGDVQTGSATVIEAIGAGKRAAQGIHSLLSENGEIMPETIERVVGFEEINVHYFNREPRHGLEGPGIEASAHEVVAEAKRCFHCGSCNICHTCWILCPDASIREINGKISVDYDYCKGCGICAEECPRGAIVIEEESRWS